MALAKELTSHSLPEIGQAFGGRDHTTVLHACRKVRELRETDPRIAEDFSKCRPPMRHRRTHRRVMGKGIEIKEKNMGLQDSTAPMTTSLRFRNASHGSAPGGAARGGP